MEHCFQILSEKFLILILKKSDISQPFSPIHKKKVKKEYT